MNKERSSRLEGRIRSGKLSRRDIVRRLGELAFGSANDCVRLVLEDCPDLDALELSLLSEVRRSDKGGVEVKLIDRLKAVEALSAAIGADDGEAAEFLKALSGGGESWPLAAPTTASDWCWRIALTWTRWS